MGLDVHTGMPLSTTNGALQGGVGSRIKIRVFVGGCGIRGAGRVFRRAERDRPHPKWHFWPNPGYPYKISELHRMPSVILGSA